MTRIRCFFKEARIVLTITIAGTTLSDLQDSLHILFFHMQSWPKRDLLEHIFLEVLIATNNEYADP